MWVITKGKSCSLPCFLRYFEYCIFLLTRHPERLRSQSVISKNSTAVTHCRIMIPFFTKKQQHWNVKCDSNVCFCLFRNSCSLERNCLMTASKNPENITVQLLSSFGYCPVYIFPYGSKLQPFLPKCRLFNQVPDYLPVQNV